MLTGKKMYQKEMAILFRNSDCELGSNVTNRPGARALCTDDNNTRIVNKGPIVSVSIHRLRRSSGKEKEKVSRMFNFPAR